MSRARTQRFKITGKHILRTLLLTVVLGGWADSVAAANFALTGSLNTARRDHTATLLPSGQVLATGGTDVNGNALASAELYAPATGAWSVTGSMSEGRSAFIAVLLSNGSVLVAGGQGSNGLCLTAAQLYNPSTGRWTPTGSMVQARCSPSAAVLPSGQVLVAGGAVSPESDDLTSELYNPSTGAWQITGSLHSARQGGAATLLNSGEVLLAGGINFTDGAEMVLTTAELYNPSSGEWNVTSSMTKGIVSPASALLGDGDVLIANAGQFLSPASASWANTGPLPKTAENPIRATLLPNGNVLASGTVCSYTGCGHRPTGSCFLYLPSTNTWSVTSSLNHARVGHTSTLLPTGKVLIAGGWSRGLDTPITVLSSAELYTP